jgi:hypothetical protein
MRALQMLLVALACTVAVYGAPIPCIGAMPVTVDMQPPPGPSGVSFSCGLLTFTNFEAVDAGARTPIVVNLVTASWDPATQWVFLNFNPNLAAPGAPNMPSVQDIWFYFDVIGPLGGVDLAVGGTGSTITERVCGSGVDRNGANLCVGGNQLAVMTAGSEQSRSVDFGRVVSQASIFKDINVREGELTSFTQSFHAVPEPASIVLIGAGLVGIAWLRKRLPR